MRAGWETLIDQRQGILLILFLSNVLIPDFRMRVNVVA